MGYDSESKGYRIYWPGKRSVTVERNVVFNQNDLQNLNESTVIQDEAQSEGERYKFIQAPLKNTDIKTEKPDEGDFSNPEISERQSKPHQMPQSSNSITFPSIQKSQMEINPESQDKDQTSNNQYGQGKRDCLPQGTYKTMNNGLIAAITKFDNETQPAVPEELLESSDGYSNQLGDLPLDMALVGYSSTDPKTLDEALHGLNAKQWQETLEYEISQLKKLNTWIVEDLPKGQTTIPCSEVIKVKQGPDREVKSYRVRIVAGGHRQVEGINYSETFSSAAKMLTVHTVLANAAHQDWEIEHIDVKSAYLNAPLKEVIYMRPPHSVLKPGQEGKVLRPLKGQYGLKQAGRGWYLEMARVFLTDPGFKQSHIDYSVFYCQTEKEHTIVAVATDNMAVTSKYAANAERFKSMVKEHWEITDHRPIQWFLGFEIKRNHKARMISINQCAYIESMVDKFRLTRVKHISTPMEPNAQFTTKQSHLLKIRPLA